MKKKTFLIILSIIIVIGIIYLVIKYKNMSINIDVVSPGSATVTSDPIKGDSIVLYEEKDTTIDIQIKNFFNVNTYPVIEDKNIIAYDENTNKLIGLKSGETTIYFENLFGFSKSNKLNITVIDKDFVEYENDVSKVREKENNIKELKNYSLINRKILQLDNSYEMANAIYLDDKLVGIDNFILNGRTYINIYEYCNKIECSINRNDDKLEISKDFNDVTFTVEHEIGTDTFNTIIQNGNQLLDYDLGSTYIDAKSCPSDGKICDSDNIYLPIRFLMQAFGYTVSWQQENKTISINNYLYANFYNDNKIMLSNNLKNPGDKIEENAVFKKDEMLYAYVTNKNNIVTDFSVIFSFSSDVENGALTDNIFEINGNNIKLLDSKNIKNSKLKLLLIQNICKEDKSDCGNFPLIIDFNIDDYEVQNPMGVTNEGDKSSGYPTTFTVNGKTYKEYKQSIPPYNSAPYWGGTIGYKGCGPTAVSIVCSGYINENPKTVANYMNSAFGYTGYDPLNKTLKHYGFNTELVHFNQNDNKAKEKLQNHLLNDGVVIMSLCSPKVGGACVNSPSYDFSAGSHIVALLGIDPNNLDNIYLSNPAVTKKGGWVSLDYVLKHVRNSGQAYYILASR